MSIPNSIFHSVAQAPPAGGQVVASQAVAMDPTERAEHELEDVKAVREEAKAALAEAKAALAKAENKLEETDKERKQAQKNLDDYVDRFPAVCVSLDFHDYHFPSKILRA